MKIIIKSIPTTPYNDQKPGTSGIRKKTTVFEQNNYTENFIQSTFNSIGADSLKGSTIVIASDGRYYSHIVGSLIVRMAVANGVSHVIVFHDYIGSTPAVSNLIRKRKALGAFILTASHNPGGPNNDFGIKFNMSNGGPAPETITNAIFEESKVISSYLIADLPENLDVNIIGMQDFCGFLIEVISSTDDYVELCKSIFDFDELKKLAKTPGFSLRFDAMNGVAGPYAVRIFVQELGFPPDCVMHSIPLPDFGGLHPDPNLVYASDLVRLQGLDPKYPVKDDVVAELGAAADGDADRNMILGNRFFVTPSDLVAIIVANSSCIPYFVKHGLVGCARSMPTSGAVDRVAAKKGILLFEVPTGWKFFGNLMDAGKCQICGEESFGTGSDHIREKDGLWAVLSWLSIIQHRSAHAGHLISTKQIVLDHWREFGRNYYTRYDYEGCNTVDAQAMMQDLLTKIYTNSLIIPSHQFELKLADSFSYTDPVDGSVSANQGIRILFKDGSRLIFRLSGTGSEGATIRLYIERYVSDFDQCQRDPQSVLSELVSIALDISALESYTGRNMPSVIT